MSCVRRWTLQVPFLAALSAALACGSDPTSPPPPDATPASVMAYAGGGDSARVGSPVSTAPAVIVRNAAGSPLSGVSVTFAVADGGGILTGASATTGSNGIATVRSWIVGDDAGANILTATVQGLSPVTFTAIGRLPRWTVMVYMAADNTLAAFGVANLYQMALAGVDPEVQVVVQAEFNPEAFSQAGFSPAVVDRSNYDTFRYVMDGSVSLPPNNVLIGPSTDIGNVDMTEPAQLRAFVQWAQQTAPAERTVLVLWNHGGDQAGLIEDETSAPGEVMTLSQLHTALAGLPRFDILYFEMCLMGGYEPMLAVQDLARTVVASEDSEYVAGWDFQRLLETMYASPTLSAPAMAGQLADAFDAAYASLGLSETISAYDLSGFSAVDAAVSQLGGALLNSQSVTAGGLASASFSVQRYEMPWVADLVDLADSLHLHFADPTIADAATAVRQAVLSPSFLLSTHHRTGTLYGQADESRSHGLTIVMPAGGESAMPSAGSASITAYTQEFPNATWGTFLSQYTSSLPSRPFVDIGTSSLTLYLVWDTTFAKTGWLEMLMYEPDGNIYSPIFGTLSPSGHFSADAQVDHTYYEGWTSNQFVESGTYYYLAWLVVDSTNYQPNVDAQYRYGNTALTSLYGPGTYPQLSLQTSFLNDPNASLTSVLSGAYTDLQAVATWTTPASSSPLLSVAPPATGVPIAASVLTTQQIAALRDLSTKIQAGRLRSPGDRAPPFGRNATRARPAPVAGHRPPAR